MKSMTVSTTDVSFDKSKAYATVAIHPNSEPAVNGGMVMKYTLEERDGKWVVIGVGDSKGHGFQGGVPSGGGVQLPPGHPATGPQPGGITGGIK